MTVSGAIDFELELRRQMQIAKIQKRNRELESQERQRMRRAEEEQLENKLDNFWGLDAVKVVVAEASKCAVLAANEANDASVRVMRMTETLLTWARHGQEIEQSRDARIRQRVREAKLNYMSTFWKTKTTALVFEETPTKVERKTMPIEDEEEMVVRRDSAMMQDVLNSARSGDISKLLRALESDEQVPRCLKEFL